MLLNARVNTAGCCAAWQTILQLTMRLLLQEPIVRQTAATALLELYSVPGNMSPLHTFTDRFQTRYAELIYDVDEIVAVKGVRAMCRLHNTHTVV